MASIVQTFGVSRYLDFNTEKLVNSRFPSRCGGGRDSAAGQSAYALANETKNGISLNERKRAPVDLGNGYKNSTNLTDKERVSDEEKLAPLWDDGYGTQTVKDYLDHAKDIIKLDGGPPRWFTPVSCGPHLKNSPTLLFLPGMDGLGLGLTLHHKSLGKVFDVWCMHIPVQDRTPFEELVKWVEHTVREVHSLSPKKPIYLVGDSLGGCLALAVAAHNPKLDLLLIVANPATSFARSQLQPILPLLEGLPNELHVMVPYALSFVMGDPLKMATVDINTTLPSVQYFEQVSGNLTALLPRLSGLADIIPKETLFWKLKLLKAAAAYANSRLHAVKAEVLVLASGKDYMLPSANEARKLYKSIPNCKVRYFKDNGHTLLLEDGINLLTIIKATNTYRRSRYHDYVMDFLPPSLSELKKTSNEIGWFRNLAGPIILSTMDDGKIVRGLAGVPNEGPVLLVGYHMLMGLELGPLVEEFLWEKNIMVRGIAHPTLFSHILESESKEFSFDDYIRVYGAMPVSASNLFKLLATKSHVLLYPGGAREALHRKGEKYKLFWPDQPEFVRMAAKFGATIVPFGVVGEDDLSELVLDYDDLMKIPFLNDQIRRDNERNKSFSVRSGMKGEVANQPMYLPGMLPKIPGRLYYLFGKPIQTSGREKLVKDKEKAQELYLKIKSEVEANISYLLKKREEDPYRGIINRTVHQALNPSTDMVPTFEP